MSGDTLQRKVWVSLAMTIAFMVATILWVSIPASLFASPAAREVRCRDCARHSCITCNRPDMAMESRCGRAEIAVAALVGDRSPGRALLAHRLSAFIYWYVTLEPRSAKPGCRRRL